MDFSTIREMLGTRGEKKVGNHTYLQSFSSHGYDAVAVLLHAHEIIRWEHHRFHEDPPQVAIRTCGYPTTTTMNRINEYLPDGWRLYRESKIWLISDSHGTYPFLDGMYLKARYLSPDCIIYDPYYKGVEIPLLTRWESGWN